MTFTRVFTIDTGAVIEQNSRTRIFLLACRTPGSNREKPKNRERKKLLKTEGANNQMNLEGCDCEGFYGSERFVVLSDFLGVRVVKER